MIDAHAFSDHLALLLRREHGALAEFLLALARFDGERRWRELGYTSLFVYLNRHLRLSKGAAFYRSTAAALVASYPEVVAPIRDGRLCLSNVVQLAKVLTRDNVEAVLPRFFGISKDEAKAIVAELCPEVAPRMREVVTMVRPAQAPGVASSRSPAAAPLAAGDDLEEGHVAAVEDSQERGAGASEDGAPTERGAGWLANLSLEPAPPPSPLPALAPRAARSTIDSPPASALPVPQPLAPPRREREVVEPLTADLRRVHVTLSRALLAKLDAARAALSHVIPDGDTEAVLDRALDLVLDAAAKRRSLVKHPRSAAASSPGAAANGSPAGEPAAWPAGRPTGSPAATPASAPVATPPAPTDPRHVPAAVARAVWRRDGARCTYPLANGERCGATWRLELDHVVPFARGGPSTVDNLRVTCAAHNQLAARQEFGDRWMDHCAGAALAPAG